MTQAEVYNAWNAMRTQGPMMMSVPEPIWADADDDTRSASAASVFRNVDIVSTN